MSTITFEYADHNAEECAKNINWHEEENVDPRGLFLSVVNKPMNLKQWALGVHFGRQLIQSMSWVDTTLNNHLKYAKD